MTKIEELARKMAQAYAVNSKGHNLNWYNVSDIIKSSWIAAARAAFDFISENPGPLADKVEGMQDAAARRKLIDQAVAKFQGDLNGFELALKHAIGPGESPTATRFEKEMREYYREDEAATFTQVEVAPPLPENCDCGICGRPLLREGLRIRPVVVAQNNDASAWYALCDKGKPSCFYKLLSNTSSALPYAIKH